MLPQFEISATISPPTDAEPWSSDGQSDQVRLPSERVLTVYPPSPDGCPVGHAMALRLVIRECRRQLATLGKLVV